MIRGRSVSALSIAAALAMAAFFGAAGIASVVEGTMSQSMTFAPSIANARASVPSPSPARHEASAQPILDRNPFDHSARSLLAPVPPTTSCSDVRTLIVAGASDPNLAIAAFEVGGKRIVRRRGGDVAGMTVFFVGNDRVWLEKDGALCESKLGGPSALPPSVHHSPALDAVQPPATADEGFIASRIVKRGPTEYEIDRSALGRILEAQTELMKARVLPEKEGDRIVGLRIFGVKPGSILSLVGIQNGDRLETVNGFDVATPERALEAYARLRGRADHLTVRITRAGKTMNLDYDVK